MTSIPWLAVYSFSKIDFSLPPIPPVVSGVGLCMVGRSGRMEENRCRCPLKENATVPSRSKWWRPWIIWAAFGWFVALFLYLPYPNIRRTPPGTFLGFKLVTTVISMVAVSVLIIVPDGWRKIVTIPLAVLLVFVQVAAWVALP
jgi:hypothetical protein